jgi:hypothetical protein
MAEYAYGWKAGPHPFSKLSAETVGLELERIEHKHGRLDAKLVVSDARRKASPLHEMIFHVDDAAAAQLHYEERARGLIRALTVRVIHAPATDPIRARISITRDGDQAYYTAEAVAADPDLQERFRQLLFAKLVALKRELIAWDEFSAVVSAIEALERQAA